MMHVQRDRCLNIFLSLCGLVRNEFSEFLSCFLRPRVLFLGGSGQAERGKAPRNSLPVPNMSKVGAGELGERLPDKPNT